MDLPEIINNISSTDVQPNISDKNSAKFEYLNFSSAIIPQIFEVKNHDKTFYLPDQGNKWFWTCQNYYEECSLHHSIIDNLYLDITKDINDKLYDNFVRSYLVYGGFAAQIKVNILGKIVDVKFLDFKKIRSGIPDENTGIVNSYFFSNTWLTRTNQKNIKEFPSYLATDIHEPDKTYIYYYHKNLMTDCYPRPYWYSCRRWLFTYMQIATFYSNLSKNNLNANRILSINTDMTEEERTALKRKIDNTLKGPDNAGAVMLIFNGAGKDNEPSIISFANEAQDQSFLELLNICRTEIAIGHQLPVALLGILVPGSLGNTDLQPHEERYQSKVVLPTKQEIDDGYNVIKNNLQL